MLVEENFCKTKNKTAEKITGQRFPVKSKVTRKNCAHLDEEKNFGLNSHLRACCTQPFKNITPLGMNCLARATVTCTRSVLAPNKSSMSEWSIAVEAYLRRWFHHCVAMVTLMSVKTTALENFT